MILAKALLRYDAFPSIAQIAAIADECNIPFSEPVSSKPKPPDAKPDCFCNGQGFYFILLQDSRDEKNISRPLVACDKCELGRYNRKYSSNAGKRDGKLFKIPMYFKNELRNCNILASHWNKDNLQ